MHGQGASAQQGCGLANFIATFQVFRPDIQQAHAGFGNSHNSAGEDLPHHGELYKMLGAAFHIRAQIQHTGLPLLGREERTDRRAADALEGAKSKHRQRHQGAGIARRYTAISLSRLNGINGFAHA